MSKVGKEGEISKVEETRSEDVNVDKIRSVTVGKERTSEQQHLELVSFSLSLCSCSPSLILLLASHSSRREDIFNVLSEERIMLTDEQVRGIGFLVGFGPPEAL